MLYTDGPPLHALNICVTLEKERGRDMRCRGERRRGRGERGGVPHVGLVVGLKKDLRSADVGSVADELQIRHHPVLPFSFPCPLSSPSSSFACPPSSSSASGTSSPPAHFLSGQQNTSMGFVSASASTQRTH